MPASTWMLREGWEPCGFIHLGEAKNIERVLAARRRARAGTAAVPSPGDGAWPELLPPVPGRPGWDGQFPGPDDDIG